jgi:toxin-antitoxin system PIN domain toxin
MNSLDTNILLYATNADCPEHPRARPVIEEMLAAPGQWVIADQVLFEYYRLVRNPAVLARPLSAAEAKKRLGFFRDESGVPHCGYEIALWPEIANQLGRPGFSAARTFDLVLAVTLKAAGVRRFYTRNVRDFRPFGFFEVVDPLAPGRRAGSAEGT